MAYVDGKNYLRAPSYTNAMERNYEIVDPSEDVPIERFDVSDTDFEGKELSPEFGVKISDLGISTAPFKDQLEQLKARIFQGAGRVELGFMGQGKGSGGQGQFTPETYGSEERRDIRELARLNKIELSSHAAVHGNSLAGFSQNQFDERQREGTLHEIQKAIDFAADTQKGGAVVFHLTEFPRPVSEFYGDQGFKAYDLEKEKAQYLLVDERTGQVIDAVRKDRQLFTPEWEIDPRTNDYAVDENGFKKPKWVPEHWEDKVIGNEKVRELVPGKFDVRPRNWQYFEQEAKRWNELHPNEPQRTAAMQQFFDQIDMQVAQSVAFARLRTGGGGVAELERQKDKLMKAIEFYRKVEDNVPEEEMWKLQRQAGDMASQTTGGIVPPELKKPSEILQDALVNLTNTTALERAGVGYFSQADTQLATKNYTKPIEKYAINKTADTLARAGIHALKRTEYMKRQPFNKGVKIDPLFIAVENAHVPDMWGSHPQELKLAILEGRKRMEAQLEHNGYAHEEAHKLAEEHIKATVDIGHANTWRKFFQGDPKKSIEENDKDFKRWLLRQTEDLIKDRIIGHVHVTDNFGYDDEHLIPGTGNAPIKEFIDRVKKLNPTIIIEPAHQDYRAALGGWKRFGAGIYGLPRSEHDTWADVEHSYFGKPAPPYFLFGESAPDPEQWQLWSQTRME